MKKIIPFILVLIFLILGYYAYSLLTEKKSALSNESLSNFAIKDTSSINRLTISNTNNERIDFHKIDGSWQFEDGTCLQVHMINNFLETIKYIAIKAPVPVGTVPYVNKEILGQHKKIEIYQHGKLSKTWYIGSSTQDHYGTYMILKIEGQGISPEPFVTFLPSGYGNLSDQFSLRKKDYQCSGIFVYKPDDIKSINVVCHSDTSQNFLIKNLGNNEFEIYNNGTKISQFDTVKVRDYIVSFKKMHYQTKEPIMPKNIRDSIIQSPPYYTLTVTNSNGVKNELITHLKYNPFEKYDYDGNLIIYDLNNLYGYNNQIGFVSIQYFVFDKTFKTIQYFKS